MKGKEVAKKSIASLLITLLIAYFFTGLLRTITLKSNISENMKDPLGNIDFIVNGNIQIQVFVPLLTVVLFGVIFSKLGGRRGYQDASDHGVHGTSRWGRFEELKKGKAVSLNNKIKKDIYKNTQVENGIIVGRNPDSKELLIIPSNTTIDNRNILVVGSSGSAKGQSYVFPNLVNNRNNTLIVTDPKGELYDVTHQLKKDQGYEVFQIDFLNLDQAKYNPLDYVKKDIDAKKIAETIARNSSKDGKEDFFFSTARDLLTGLIIYAKEINSNANIPFVKSLFYKVSEDEKFLKELCEDIGTSHPAYNYLKDASVSEGKTRSSILSSFSQQTAIFSLQDVAKMTVSSDFNFHDFQKKKSILYVKVPMKSNPVEALTATFFDQLISVFYDIADKNGGKLPLSVDFLLDEFANLGKINDYEGTLSTCRGLGISMQTIIQDFAQLETKYGKEEARTIINNHDTLLYLKTKDNETAKYFSVLAGDTTARMYTSSSSTQGGIFTTNSSASKSRSEQLVKKPLITEGELINIKKDDCYVFVTGYYPLKMKKSFQHELYGDLLSKAIKLQNGDTKFVPNFSSHRNNYLKALGLDSLLDEKKEDSIASDGGMELQEEVAATREIVQSTIEKDEPNVVTEKKEDEAKKIIESMAKQYVNGEFSLIEQNVLNGDIIHPEKDEEVEEQFKELSEIVDLVKIEKSNFIEAEKSLQEIQGSEELLNSIDELDDILGSYFDEPDKLSNELNEDFSLVE